MAVATSTQGPANNTAGVFGPISIDAEPIALNPQAPSMTAIGDFHYAGGLVLGSRQTNELHELSDIVITGTDRITVVGDGGVLLEARLVLDGSGRLTGVTDGRLTRLVGETGRPLSRNDSDAEGLTILPSG